MTIFDTYDKIIENIQQIPLDVYLYMRRNRRLTKKLNKINRKHKKMVRLAFRGIEVDMTAFEELSAKLSKTRMKLVRSAEILQSVMLNIYDRTNQIINLEASDVSIPKLSVDGINRIVKVGRSKDKGPNYCICKQKAFDNMIACDNIKCNVGCFHFECAGITLPPKSIWLCSECRKHKDLK